jgi:hypothetical protein
MKFFDKCKTPQKNSYEDKDIILFVIKSDKSELFFNQSLKWRTRKKIL